MENSETVLTKENSAIKLEPIGTRILGNLDPKNLTEDQFKNSPDLLFHGSPTKFKFSREFNYSSAEYCEKSDGSQTLGEGFYTTAERDTAENYSLVRQHYSSANQIAHEITPVVVELLPHQAKVLDLRAKTDLTKIAPITEEFFNKWFIKYQNYYQESRNNENLPWYIKAQEAKYMEYLIKLKELKPELILRLVLGTAAKGNLPLPLISSPSPPWMKLFSNFMLEEGYDGLVYNEGGEGINAKKNTSYVFYNLDKIGSFESWQESSNQLQQ